MKCRIASLPWLLVSASAFAQLPAQIKHVVIVFQENRTPDNLFQALPQSKKCAIPAGASGLKACVPEVSDSCYDVSPCGLSNYKTATDPVPVKLDPVYIAGSADPDHSHYGFVGMCNPNTANNFDCRNDGAYRTTCKPGSNGACTIDTYGSTLSTCSLDSNGVCTTPTSYGYVYNAPVTNYGPNGPQPAHLLDPYTKFATQYGWANFMYQTNQGPSYPAHQFLFSGTSSFTAATDADAEYVSSNFNGKTIGNAAGCLLPPYDPQTMKGGSNLVIAPSVPNSPPPTCVDYPDKTTPECIIYPGSVFENTVVNSIQTVDSEPIGTYCYPHANMASLLDSAKKTWKYYSPTPGSIWTAPDSFQKICVPAYHTVMVKGQPTQELYCTGAEWNANVDTDDPYGNNLPGTQILSDIENCNLAGVSWVIPDGAWSDHAGPNDQYGPSWVAAVINKIGNQAKCTSGQDAGETLWDNTAIIVTWDDWGGWSDNQRAPYLSSLPCNGSSPCLGDYQYGFRVPLLVVSAYTAPQTISDTPHDFGSILRFVEGVNGIPEGQLGFADARSTTDLREFFTLGTPRKYQTVYAEYPAKCFIAAGMGQQLSGCFPVKAPSPPDND